MKCPYCGSNKLTLIVYGYPGAEMWKQHEQGKIILGGCVIDDDCPTHYCNECEKSFQDPKKIKRLLGD